MDIGLGLNQILAMVKKKDDDSSDVIVSPPPDPVVPPEPGPAPDVAIPGILDAAEIVVLGSPIAEAAFGSPEPGTGIAAYAAQAGFSGRIRVRSDGGTGLAGAKNVLRDMQAETRASTGHKLYLLHTGLEEVSDLRPLRGGAETLAAEYRELVAEAASKGDKVIPVPLTKVLYGRGAPGYPNNPHDVADGNPASEAFGTQPFNREIFQPVLETQAPGWASSHLTSQELAERLSLVVDRPSVVAGEAVYLKIDGLTDEEAGTWGFLWEFDTSGEFQYLPDLPWHMRQKNRAVGHQQTAAWDSPGTKTVKVRVVPPLWSGKKGAVLTVDVENIDPNVHFLNETWYVDPLEEWPGAEADWNLVADISEANRGISSLKRGRILLRRGQTYSKSGALMHRDHTGGTMLAAGPGTEAMPVMDISRGGFSYTNGNFKTDFLLVKDISFVGGYEVTDGALAGSHIAFHVNDNTKFTANGCNFEHMSCAIVTIGYNKPGNMIGVWDCRITHWQNYGIYIQSSEKFMCRGSYICQDRTAPAVNDMKPNAAGTTTHSYPDHGPIRISDSLNSAHVMTQLQLFSINAWIGGSTPTDGSGVQPSAFQSVLRFCTKKIEGSVNALIAEIYSEGGGYTIGGGATGGAQGAGLVCMHGNYHIAASNWCGWSISTSGSWVRDNILVVPDVKRDDVNKASWGGFGYPKVTSNSSNPEWKTKPVHIFNNTVAWMLSPENIFASASATPNAPVEYSDIMGGGSFTSDTAPDVMFTNNLLWAPNITLVGEESPRVPDGIHSANSFGPVPMYRGRHFLNRNGVLELDTQYATPADAAILPLVARNSALCGTADKSLLGVLDFFGRVRGTEAAVGSIEPNLSNVLNPIVDPYDLGDRYPRLLGETESYGCSLGRYLLARVAAGALGLGRGASRAGKAILYNLGQGHPDDMTIGRSNRVLSLTDYTGFPLLCGATFLDGGFDPFVEVDVEPGFETGVTYDATFAYGRIADSRFHRADAINGGLAIGKDKTHRLHIAGLTPGDRVTVSCVGITTAKGPKRGEIALIAGSGQIMEVLDAASDAASNMAVFEPVSVPGTGRISLAVTPEQGSDTAYLSAVMLDFS